MVPRFLELERVSEIEKEEMKKKKESKFSPLIQLSFTILFYTNYISAKLFSASNKSTQRYYTFSYQVDPEAHRNHFTFNTVKPSLFHVILNS